MKKYALFIVSLIFCLLFTRPSFSQNVGIGTTAPAGKLHIKGSADTSQLVIDAHTTQSNSQPLIRFRNAAGKDLMHINTDEDGNVFIGLNAGRNSYGANSLNTFVGNNAGAGNTKGFKNTANGSFALFSNTDGSHNTANGAYALFSNTGGYSNTANGTTALFFNTTGYRNTANGDEALHSNTTGNNNTANGVFALSLNTSGINNTANGAWALYNNTTGGGNTANGYSALSSNSTGSYNTSNGYNSLYRNSTGSENTANGVDALYYNTTGIRNVAIGNRALYSNVTGNNNIAIGYYSGTGSGNLTNTISIGNDGYPNGASNQAFIGNKSTVWIGGNVGWSTFSDARIKTNILENVKGLDFIMKLRPVTYFKNLQAETKITGATESADFEGKYDVEKILQSGFLAQEVEQAAKKSGYDFSGVHVPKNDKQLYSLSYAEFVVPLVKAMQEQQVMIEAQNKLIKELEKRIAALERK